MERLRVIEEAGGSIGWRDFVFSQKTSGFREFVSTLLIEAAQAAHESGRKDGIDSGEEDVPQQLLLLRAYLMKHTAPRV
jgi:hypothetical protein